MTSLSTMPYYFYLINGVKVYLGDPTKYIMKSLSVPQYTPIDHFDLKQGIICGPIGSGKSTTKAWISSIARDIWPPRWDKLTQKWRKSIEFFDARDMGGLIESLRESTAYLKFIVFEDANKGATSRHSGKDNGVSKFTQILHLIKEDGI